MRVCLCSILCPHLQVVQVPSAKRSHKAGAAAKAAGAKADLAAAPAARGSKRGRESAEEEAAAGEEVEGRAAAKVWLPDPSVAFGARGKGHHQNVPAATRVQLAVSKPYKLGVNWVLQS